MISDVSARPGIKSRPAYRPLSLDVGGTRHLLVTDQAAPPPEAAALVQAGAVESWVVAADSQAIPGPPERDAPAPWPLRFRSAAQLLARLAFRLAGERMGFRLYAVGTEPFLWDVFNRGAVAGLGVQEMQLAHAGSARRRVICVHCGTVMEAVTTSIVACAGCRAALFVRDHFSRRLAGYQGVQADAEEPGAVPQAEELYR